MFSLETLKSKTAICIYLWFLWNLVQKYVAPHLPDQAATMINTGLISAGGIALREALQKLQNVVEPVAQALDPNAPVDNPKIGK